MTRVIHTADTHLGYRQYHRPERREDFLTAFQQVAEDAIADDVDAVVHAGDLFHDRRPGLQDILGTISVLRTLDDADVPFLAIVGNHETKRDAQWLDLFESLGLATRLDERPVMIGETAFYGLDFVPRSRREQLEYEFEPHNGDHAALVAHGLFEPFEYADWDTERLLSESNIQFDALLLGDNHTPQKTEIDGAWVTYCGSTERASADEREDRGYNIVDFSDTDTVSITRRGIPTREFVFVDIELADSEGIERVRERIGQYDLEDAVLIVTIDGDGDPVTPAQIEEYADEKGALVARVTDHREISDTDDVDVNFADPDDAVRERVRELGLSQAARDIDETVRASKIADANVTDEVERHVRTLIEDDSESVSVSDDDADEDRSTDDRSPADGRAVVNKPTETETDIDTDTESEAEADPADVELDEKSDEEQPTLGEYE